MRLTSVLAIAVVSCLLGQTLYAGLSANIVTNGSFESTGNVKTDNLGSGKRPWQFNSNYTPEEQVAIGRANDLGYWIGDYSGISTFDDPRAQYNTTHIGLGTSDVMTPNISVGNGGHMLETVGFRSSVFQVLEAPASQGTGTASISFDYFWKQWTSDPNGPTRFRVWVYGLPSLPDMADSSWMENDNTAVGLAGESLLWASPFWDTEWTDWVDPVWHITTPPNPPAWQNYAATFNLAQTYPYYYVRYHGVTYHENHNYFWQDNGKPTDTFALGIDNFSLQLPTAVVLGDVNLDGNVNALDISGFINRLTTGTYQAEADINEDLAVNALDISGFVSCLTGGACGSGAAGGSVVPEPTSVAFILLSGAALLRRR